MLFLPVFDLFLHFFSGVHVRDHKKLIEIRGIRRSDVESGIVFFKS